jgi:oligopeptidase B
MEQRPAAPGPVAPAAERIPAERVHHGDTVADPYAWLTDPANPDVTAYLEAENAYTDAVTAGQAGLREEIFAEIKGRTKQADLSVPSRYGAWWYYSRTVEGQQYAIHCRAPAAPGTQLPPSTEDGSPLPGEQVLLDGNQAAAGSGFFALGTFDVSPDGRLLAYSTDLTGGERYTLRVKDLAAGQLLAEEIPGVYYGSAWSADSSVLFYVTADESWRPYRVWRHAIGAPARDDVLVFEETDRRFSVGIGLTRSRGYLVLTSSSAVTSEAWLLDAADPSGEFTVVAPRRQGVEYQVDHQRLAGGADRLIIVHNDGAEDFELSAADPAGPAAWTPVIPHRPGTRLLGADPFLDHLVVYFRRDGLTGLRIIGADGADGSARDVDFSEPLYTVFPGANPEYETTAYQLRYTSLVTPPSVYQCDLTTGALTLLKRTPVLELPGRGPYRPGDYVQHREWATAPDGTQIPLSLVARRGVPRDGSAPCMLYGYGSYEASIDPAFSIRRLSLLDRGFVVAIAHVRGGGEMGRRWYEDGKLLAKRNTFTDFVAAARHLAATGWTAPGRLIARGGSAGGLLVGAAVNIDPAAFGGIVAEVPFVDALNTILDPSLPLTVTEWEEWGDPLHDPASYAYMKSYAPYENITGQCYPPVLATAGLNDTRVLYHEPAKWVARLRAEGRCGPFLLKVQMGAGHRGPSGRYDAWAEEAFITAWMVSTAAATGSPAPGGVPAGSGQHGTEHT